MVDPIPPEKWEQHKEEILRLYIDEDLPLRHVMKRVCTPDFHPDESQYRSKLKTWRQRKARKSHKVAKGLTATKGALRNTDIASAPPNSNRDPHDSKRPTESNTEQTESKVRSTLKHMGRKVSQYFEILFPYKLTIVSGQLLQGVRDPVPNHFNFPGPIWGPVPSSMHPSEFIGMTDTDPHADAAYSDQRLFPQTAPRKSVAEGSHGSAGQPRVERAVRQRSSNRVDKDPPWTRTQHPYSAGSGFPDRLVPAPANSFGHRGLDLQYPPSNPEPDFEWWEGAGPFVSITTPVSR